MRGVVNWSRQLSVVSERAVSFQPSAISFVRSAARTKNSFQWSVFSRQSKPRRGGSRVRCADHKKCKSFQCSEESHRWGRCQYPSYSGRLPLRELRCFGRQGSPGSFPARPFVSVSPPPSFGGWSRKSPRVGMAFYDGCCVPETNLSPGLPCLAGLGLRQGRSGLWTSVVALGKRPDTGASCLPATVGRAE